MRYLWMEALHCVNTEHDEQRHHNELRNQEWRLRLFRGQGLQRQTHSRGRLCHTILGGAEC